MSLKVGTEGRAASAVEVEARKHAEMKLEMEAKARELVELARPAPDSKTFVGPDVIRTQMQLLNQLAQAIKILADAKTDDERDEAKRIAEDVMARSSP